MREPRRILLIRRKAVGDVLVSMPVAAALRRAFPAAKLTLVVDRFASGVVAGSPLLDDVWIYDRNATARGGVRARGRALHGWLARIRGGGFDVTLDLMGTPQTALWTWWSRAAVRVGRRRRLRSWAYTHRLPRSGAPGRFAGDVFLDWVRALGVQAPTWTPVPVPRSTEVDRAARAAIAQLAPGGRPRVVLNPSATWSAKAWPPGHFAVLAELLASELGASVLLAWGPGEERARDAIMGQARSGCLVALPPTNLPELAAHLACVDLVITTDSGPKHIAVAEGTPTLTLFGSTDPRGWQAPGSQHAWITHDVPCRPCDKTVCPVAGHPCLDALSPRDVLESARELLARQASHPSDVSPHLAADAPPQRR